MNGFPAAGRARGARFAQAADVEEQTELDGRARLDDQPSERLELGAPWRTIVWNDPVNLMSYVTYVFTSYFGFTEQRATELMLAVHHEGKAVVAHGTREEMERHVQAMHEYGLWATLDKADV